MTTTFCTLLLATGLALHPAPDALAQTLGKGKVYTSAELMPTLPGGGGTAAIASAIQHNYRYPADAVKAELSGRILVSFVVLETGFVDQVKVEKKLSPSTDAAAIRAVQGLPLVRPGMQDGQKVAVRLTVPITLVNGGPPSPPKPLYEK